MGRRKKTNNKPVEVRPNDHWVVSDEYTANGRIIKKNTELSIEGVVGRYRFIRHVLNPKNGAEWIDVVGGPKGYSCSRSYRPERIKRVHYKNKTGENLAAQRKQRIKDAKEEKEVE